MGLERNFSSLTQRWDSNILGTGSPLEILKLGINEENMQLVR